MGALDACGQPQGPSPMFRVDLQPHGFITEARGKTVGSYSDLNFLSDDLILATINNRVFGPVEKVNSDEPPSKLLLFEISGKRLLRTFDAAVEKREGSVKALQGGRFAVLNESGVRLCSRDFECGPPLPTEGALRVSPSGTRVIVGGYGQTEQKLLDGATLTELDRFPWKNPSVVPCDRALLLIKGHSVSVQPEGKPNHHLPFDDADFNPDVRCISQTAIADFESEKALAVVDMNGVLCSECLCDSGGEVLIS